MKELLINNSDCYAIVDDDVFEEVFKYNWRVLPRGYIVRSATKAEIDKGYPKTIYLHRQVMNFPDGLQIDHINTNKLDNRKENLRVVTNKQNHRNRPKRPGCSSKFKGVSWSKKDREWVVAIRLGCFKSEEEAAKTYDDAALKLFGQYARTNKMEGLI